MPKQGILSLHSGCNVGQQGDATLFFGLSGECVMESAPETHTQRTSECWNMGHKLSHLCRPTFAECVLWNILVFKRSAKCKQNYDFVGTWDDIDWHMTHAQALARQLSLLTQGGLSLEMTSTAGGLMACSTSKVCHARIQFLLCFVLGSWCKQY